MYGAITLPPLSHMVSWRAQAQFYITLVTVDYAMSSLSIRFKRKCRNQFADPNSRTTMATNNILAPYLSRQADSICSYETVSPPPFTFHVTWLCVLQGLHVRIISLRIRQVNVHKFVWQLLYKTWYLCFASYRSNINMAGTRSSEAEGILPS
jgi:hypothetical protein